MATTTIEQVPDDAARPAAGEDVLYEFYDGRLVESPLMGAREGLIANILSRELWLTEGVRTLGVVVVEILFRLVDGLKIRPDLAFVPFERWTEPDPADADVWPLVPSLAVEVVSPTNTANEVQRKVHHYFASGVEFVWVIYPQEREVYVYRGPKDVSILDGEDELSGDPAVPNFRLPVRVLFESARPGVR